MTAYTIALMGQKGGIGKSLISTILAVEATRRGHDVLLIDADPQGTNLTWADLAKANGHLVPKVIRGDENIYKTLPLLKDQYDFIVIDCPGRIDAIQRSALAVSDLAIAPCKPSHRDFWALGETLDLLRKATQKWPDLAVRLLVNMRKGNTEIGERAQMSLMDTGFVAFQTEFYDRITHVKADEEGQIATIYSPQSQAAREIRALFDEIEESKNENTDTNTQTATG